MICSNCGKPLEPDRHFCTACGAPVSVTPGEPIAAPPTPPIQQKPVKGFREFLRSPAGIAIIAAVALLIVTGIVLGVVFATKGGATKKAVEEANRLSGEALEKMDDAGEALENVESEAGSLNFLALERAKDKVDDIEDELKNASSKLDEAIDDLGEIDARKLPEWWKEYISLLEKSCNEGKEAVKETGSLLTRGLDMGEFATEVNAAASSFEASVNTQNQAADQHAAGQYSAARSTSQTALNHLSEAKKHLEKANQIEPGADLGRLTNNITVAEGALSKFQSACDAAAAGNLSQHNTLVDQYNQEKNNISMDMTFDGEAYFGKEAEKATSSAEGHLEKAKEYREKAGDLKKKNE